MKLRVFVLRRLLLLLPVVLGVMTIVFLLFSALPVEDQILTQVSPSGIGKSHCAAVAPTCACTALGIGSNASAVCSNPAYWRVYRQLGLNLPAPERWGLFMYRSLTLQWGNVGNGSALSISYPYSQYRDQPVAVLLEQELPYTLELAVLSLTITLAVTLPLGRSVAVHRNGPLDQSARVLSFSGFALPAYLFASVLLMGTVILLQGWAHGAGTIATPWCPTRAEPIYNELTGSWPLSGCYVSGPLDPATNMPAWLLNGLHSTPTGFPTIDAALHRQYWLALDTVVRMLLPALVVAYGSIATLLRFVRNSMLEVLNLDYVRTARAKGLPESLVVKRHAGRNSMNTTVTVLGLTFAFIVGGFPLVEVVFQLNGVGRALALSIQPPFDFGTIFGTTLLFTFLVVVVNLIVDLLYAYLDPRVRLGSASA